MQSETIGKLAGALAKAQGAFPAIPKNKNVEVRMKSGGTFNYSYAPLESILSACRPALSEHGLAIMQTLDEGDGGAILETMLVHESGEWKNSVTTLGNIGDPQAFGGKLTYFRRYQVSAILGVSSEDDDDANSATGKDATVTKKQQPQRAQEQKPAPVKQPAKVNAIPLTGFPAMVAEVNAELGGEAYSIPHAQNAIKKLMPDFKIPSPQQSDAAEILAGAKQVLLDHARAPKESEQTQTELDEFLPRGSNAGAAYEG